MPVPASSVRHPRHAVAALAATLLLALAIEQAVAFPLPVDSGASALVVASPSHLVLSELLTGGASASDEFIELYNPTLLTQPLEGLEVVYVTSTGATVTRKATWAAGAVGLPSGAHLLIANSAGIFAGIADLTYANGLAATGGSVALRVVGAPTAIDAVGWGTAASTWLETRPAPAPAAGSSLERLPGGPSGSGQDTDDNLVDFASQPVPDPQNSGSPPIVMPTPTPTPTPTPGATPPPTDGPTPIATPSASETPGPSSSDTPTPTPMPTDTPAPTAMPTATATPSPSPTPTPTPTPSPISVAEARALPDGAAVLVEGVALTDGDFTDGGGYLTDGSAGIAVLLSDGAFARGQLLRVAGIVDDRYAQRTIRSSMAQVTFLGVSAEPLPADSDTGAIGEAVEGQLVELTGLISSAATTLSAGVAWDVDDGSGPIRVAIGTSTGIDTAGWGRGVGLTLVGVVGQRDSSGSGTTGFRVQPRDVADLLAVEPAATPTPTPTPGATPTLEPTLEPTPIPTPTDSPMATATGEPSADATASPSATPGVVPLVAIGEARAAATGTHLRIRGVVTAQSGLLEPGSAVVQDTTGAILVRLGTRAGSLSLGQFVELDGVRATKAGMLSLRVSLPPVRLGTQADPTPAHKATGALGEADEARLVVTRGVVTGTVTRSRSGAVSLAIDDGSGPIRVTISPRTGIATASIKRGAWIEVRGVLGQATTARAPLAGYRLWPRMRADLAVVAAPVAGAGAAAGGPCCTSHGPAPTPTAAGLVAAGHGGSRDGVPGVPPILARPFPTSIGVPTITVAQPSIVNHGSPRAAGLVVSGMGIGALAGLAAWLARRRRPDDGDPADLAPATLDPAAASDAPRLSLVRVGEEEAEEERRILPPT